MKRFFQLTLIIYLLATPYIIKAQKFGTSEYKSEFNKALKFIKDDEFRYAYAIFESLYKSNPDNANIQYHMGICLMDQKYEKDEALQWLLKAADNFTIYYKSTPNETSAPVYVLYQIGVCYHYASNYKEAKKWYQEFVNRADPAKIAKDVSRAKEKMDWCDNPSLIIPPNLDSLLALNKKPPVRNDEYYSKIGDALEIVNLDHFHALYILIPILEMDPNNCNVNYFLGIACLNIRDLRHLAPIYLSKAVEKVDPRLIKKNAYSQAAPKFANYYLGLAWYENSRCDLAVPNYRAFLTIIGQKDPYANEIVEHKIELCLMQQAELDSILLANNRNPKDFDLTEDSVNKVRTQKDTTIARLVEDTAVLVSKDGYFYAVQVGAGNINMQYFEELRKLDKNNNLPFPYRGTKKAKTDEIPGDRLRRFIIGKFKTKEEALPLLKQVIEMGYKDAFIGQFQEHVLQE